MHAAEKAASTFAGMQPKAGKGYPALDITAIRREFERTEAEQAVHLSTWRSCFNLAMPNRQVFDNQQPGQRKDQEVMKSLPMTLTRRGVNNMIGALMPPERKWVELVAGPEVPAERHDEINAKLEELRDILFSELARSNHASAAHAMGLDMMCSMGAMALDPADEGGDSPLHFTAAPLGECFPVEGPDGLIENFYRRYKVKVGHIRRMWPAANLPERLSRLEESDPGADVCIVEGNIWVPGRGWRFVVFTDEHNDILHQVDGDDPDEPSRWITPRLMVAPGEVYGRGPLVEALPDMRVLNKREENSLKWESKALFPAMAVNSRSGLNPNTIRTGPQAVNMFDGNLSANDVFAQMPVAGAIDINEAKTAELRASLEATLFAQQVLPPVELSHTMTAAEVMVRRQALLQEQGVDFGRVQREWLFTTIRRAYWILSRTLREDGQPFLPQIKLDNRVVKIKYSGPMALAQEADEATAISSWAAEARAAVGDEVFTARCRVEEIPSELAKRRNVPSVLLRSDAELAQMAKNAEAMARQQAEQAPTA